MTPVELNTYIRQRTNTSSDTFWSDAELYTLMYDAQMQMAREGLAIQATHTVSTVAGTQSYAFPTYAIAIKRVTYNGMKLRKITFREDDQLTGLNQASTSQGTPQYYAIWDKYIYLRLIPDAIQSLVMYTYDQPQLVTAVSTFDVPTEFHLDIADYVLAQMYAKEKNFAAAQYWNNQWLSRLMKVKQWARKANQSDAFAGVQDLDAMNESFLGTV